MSPVGTKRRLREPQKWLPADLRIKEQDSGVRVVLYAEVRGKINEYEARLSPEQQRGQHCDDCPHVSHCQHYFPCARCSSCGHLHSVQHVRCIRLLLRLAPALLAAYALF